MITRRRALAFCAGAAAMATGLVSGRGSAEGFEVDLALVLAVDCSYSVDGSEFRQQMEGLGQAFTHNDVLRAIRSGELGRIAISVFQWSNEINRKVVLPWTVLSGGDETVAIGNMIRAIPRSLSQGGTSISSAMLFGEALLLRGPKAERRVIDISSDGRNNTGLSVTLTRDQIVAEGIVINGLVILNEWPTLDKYFEREVVGGKGHFVVPVNSYADYAEGIHRKLLREITGPGMS